MTMTAELTRLTAYEAVKQLKKREISPLELVDASISRIEAVDGKVNALPIRFFDEARATARKIQDTPVSPERLMSPAYLAGLPIAVKDLNNVKGQRTTGGSPIFANRVAAESDATVRRLEGNGAIPMAKSNVPEFGGSNTFNTLFGATRNPWNLTYSAGGSSGGSGAALAAGEVWLATGNDLGGSLRIPASFCGIVALRPSLGLVGRPEFMQPFDPMLMEGPMARTVQDAALMLDAQVGASFADPFAFDPVVPSYAEACMQPMQKLRIAFSSTLGISKVDPKVAAICSAAALRYADAGCEVSEACPSFAGAMESFKTLRAILFASLWGDLTTSHPDQLPPWIFENISQGFKVTALDVIQAERTRAAIYRGVTEFFKQFDILAIPVVALPPFPVEMKYPTEIAGELLQSYIDWMILTCATTILACPIVSVPCGLSQDGLPIGLQLIGPPRSEVRLLQAARYMEERAGVRDRLPVSGLPR